MKKRSPLVRCSGDVNDFAEPAASLARIGNRRKRGPAMAQGTIRLSSVVQPDIPVVKPLMTLLRTLPLGNVQ